MRIQRGLASSQVSSWLGASSLAVPANIREQVWVGAPVSVSESAHYSTDAATNVWDGNQSTKWNTNSTNPAWTVADFGVPITVSRITALSAAVAKTWTLAGSNDNVNWTTVVATVNAPLSTPSVYDFAPATYRYWKMSSANAWTDPIDFKLYYA